MRKRQPDPVELPQTEKRENACVGGRVRQKRLEGAAAAAETAVHSTPRRSVGYLRGSRRDAERGKRGEERRKSFFTFFL